MADTGIQKACTPWSLSPLTCARRGLGDLGSRGRGAGELERGGILGSLGLVWDWNFWAPWDAFFFGYICGILVLCVILGCNFLGE